jgi:hypothetical protein
VATLTTNFGLRKPAGGDIVAVQADIGANMDIIDATLFEREGLIETLEEFLPVAVVKTADESVTSSTTLQNDDHLFYNLPEAGSYLYDFYIGLTCNATGKFDYELTFPAGATLDMMAWGITDTVSNFDGPLRSRGAPNDSSSPTTTLTVAGDTTSPTLLRLHGYITTPISGTLRIRWAQNVSNATPATVYTGSHLIVERVA